MRSRGIRRRYALDVADERQDEPGASAATPHRRERDEDPLMQRRRQTRVDLGMEACPDCGTIHPARWARWQALGNIAPGDLVGPVCTARSPLMTSVYGTVWRVLAVESTSKYHYPTLRVEAVQPGPWAREDEDMQAEVDGRHVFPSSERRANRRTDDRADDRVGDEAHRRPASPEDDGLADRPPGGTHGD